MNRKRTESPLQVITSRQYRERNENGLGTPRSVARGGSSSHAKGKPTEQSIHLALCTYVRAKYPQAIFTSESSGVRLTMGQAIKAKRLRSSSGLPDFWLVEPRGGYHGLFLELKRSDSEVYRKDYTLKQDKHVMEQAAIIERLFHKGYLASFACGLEQAIDEVDNYMNLES